MTVSKIAKPEMFVAKPISNKNPVFLFFCPVMRQNVILQLRYWIIKWFSLSKSQFLGVYDQHGAHFYAWGWLSRRAKDFIDQWGSWGKFASWRRRKIKLRIFLLQTAFAAEIMNFTFFEPVILDKGTFCIKIHSSPTTMNNILLSFEGQLAFFF